MPFGGSDWLALTAEPTIEPELPICDPHHHSPSASHWMDIQWIQSQTVIALILR
jgi:hypothetical protein